MATYAALTNSHILTDIFEYFNSDDRRDVNDHLPAWARAARVCVAFHGPAIRLLWRKLDSVVPLLNLLPSSFTKVKAVDVGEGVGIYMLNGNIDPQEWERMREHAECVQTLSLTSHPQTPIALTTWVYLAHLTQNCPLLPNLRLFSCKLELPQSAIMIRVLLSPSITDLLIYCNIKSHGKQWEYSLRPLFDMICCVSTHLRRIEFTTGSTRRRIPLTVLSPIRRLQSLRILSLRMAFDIDFQSLRSVIFGMRSLEVLDFLNSLAKDPGPVLERFKFGLDNLHTLSVASLASSMDVKFYRWFSSSNLHTLHNYFHHFSNASESVTTFSSIVQSFPCLQELFLVMDFDRRAQEHLVQGKSPSLGSMMWQLSALHTITSLTLQVKGFLDASTDADMDALANAFPLLTTFQINCSPLPGAHCPSAAALVSFGLRCPKLKTLRLPSMHVVERDLSRLANYPVLNHGLETLFFSSFESADDHHFAALLLDRLFPRLAIANVETTTRFTNRRPNRPCGFENHLSPARDAPANDATPNRVPEPESVMQVSATPSRGSKVCRCPPGFAKLEVALRLRKAGGRAQAARHRELRTRLDAPTESRRKITARRQ